MAKFYIRHSELQTEAASLERISRTLNGLERRLNAIANAMDGRDSNMASLKAQVKKCGRNIPGHAGRARSLATVVGEARRIYSQGEKEVHDTIFMLQLVSIVDILTSKSGDQPNLPHEPTIRDVLETISDCLKNSKKAISSIDDLYDLFGKDSALIDAMKKTGVYKAIKYTSDATKLLDAIYYSDTDKLTELAKKYLYEEAGEFVLKNTYGTTGFAAKAYLNLAWNLGENLLDIDKFAYGTSKSPLVGFAQYTWHVTGGTLLETGSEMAYEIVEGIGGLLGYDIDQAYENLVGVGGVEGYYKATKDLAGALFGGYYTDGGVGGAVAGTVDLVSSSLGWWGSTITGWFK